MCGFLESVLDTKRVWSLSVRCWRRHGSVTQPELASQYVNTSWELQKLLGNRFWNHGLKSTDLNSKIRTDCYGIPIFCGFRKSLATSINHLLPSTLMFDFLPNWSHTLGPQEVCVPNDKLQLLDMCIIWRPTPAPHYVTCIVSRHYDMPPLLLWCVNAQKLENNNTALDWNNKKQKIQRKENMVTSIFLRSKLPNCLEDGTEYNFINDKSP